MHHIVPENAHCVAIYTLPCRGGNGDHDNYAHHRDIISSNILMMMDADR